MIERIERLKTLVIEVKAGRATRRYSAVKGTEPDDLVFQSLVKRSPMRDKIRNASRKRWRTEETSIRNSPRPSSITAESTAGCGGAWTISSARMRVR